MTIDELGEFGLISRIQSLLPPTKSPDLVLGIGDDVAVFEAGNGRVWLATCDVQVEGSHFLRQAISPRDLGHKALAINLSDIASAGGKPRYALVSLGLPKGLDTDFVDELYKGFREEGESCGLEIIGGNLSSVPHGIFIDIFLLGEARKEEVLTRSGARPGDRILVTGRLGDAAAGVALLLNPSLDCEENYRGVVTRRRDRPEARVREGLVIAASNLAHAMIDISDGLAGDLGHICERSRVGARIDAEALPVSPENRRLSAKAKGDEWHFALHGGEDYELLFTAAPEAAEKLQKSLEEATGTKVSIIGEVLDRKAGLRLAVPGRESLPILAKGWDHFGAGGGKRA